MDAAMIVHTGDTNGRLQKDGALRT